jgi:hypothetical protein
LPFFIHTKNNAIGMVVFAFCLVSAMTANNFYRQGSLFDRFSTIFRRGGSASLHLPIMDVW